MFWGFFLWTHFFLWIGKQKDDVSPRVKYNFYYSTFDDSLRVPQGFKLVHIKRFDKKRNAQIDVTFPRSVVSTEYDKKITLYFRRRINRFLRSLDSAIRDNAWILNGVQSEFYVEPVSIYKNRKLISYCFIVDTDRSGWFHSITEYYSFNYDLLQKKQINFFNFFDVKSRQDSAFFVNKINAVIKNNKEYNGIDGVEKMYDIDFNLEKDSINFNFDDYEIAGYAAGIIKLKVDKKNLLQKIKKEYR